MELFKIFGTLALNGIDTVNSELDGVTSKAKSTQGGFSSACNDIGNKFQSVGSKVTGLGTKLAPVSAGVVAVGGAMLATAKKTADQADTIDKLSQKMGISRKAYQEWDYILSQNGASIDSLKVGMKTMNNQLDAVRQKGDTTGSAFARLGISLEDLEGKSNEEVFEDTIKALQNCKDETERTKLATQLFGKAGVELAPLLNSGAESTEKLKQKAHDLGLVLDDETIDAGVNMTDAMDNLKRTFATMGYTIGGAVMPHITKFCNYASSNLPKVADFVKGIAERIDSIPAPIKKVIATILAVLAVASPVLIITGKIITGVGTIITTIPKLVSGVQTVIGGFSKLFSVMLANPIVLIIAAIAALVAAFVYLWNTNEGFRNFWINLWNNIKSVCVTVVNAIKDFLTSAWNAIKSVTTSAWNAIKSVTTTAWDAIKAAITTVANAIKSVITTVWNAIKSIITTVWNGIKSTTTSVWNAIKSVITTVVNGIKSVVTSVFNAVKSIITTVWNGIKSTTTSVWNAIKSVITTVVNGIKSVVTSVFNAVKSTVTSIWNGIKSTTTSVWNAVKTAVSTPVNAIKSTVTSVFNSVRSTVSSVFNSIRSTATSVWNGIKSAITRPVEAARDAVGNAIQRMRSFFHFSWSLPHLALPHLSISGRFSIDPPSVPSFGISWYKKAMEQPYLFTQPTIFGMNPATGQAKGAGEAGDEMMYGKTNLMNDIRTAVAAENNDVVQKVNEMFNRLLNILEQYFPEFANLKMVLDSGALVGELAPAMDEEIGDIIRKKERGANW